MSDFAHLHVHSHYSLLDGLGKVPAILNKAKEYGMKSIALTDHGVMYGIIEFVRLAKEMNIKPIIGVEAYLAPNGHEKKRGKIDTNPRHVTLLAKDNTGYNNLVELNTKAHLKGYYYKPRIDYGLLEEYNEGLIVLSGCMNGDIPKAIINKKHDDVEKRIKWYLDVFGRDRFYLEVQHHPNINEQVIVNEGLIKLSKKHDLNLVATSDTHYVNPEDAEAQDVLLCVQTGKMVQDKGRMCMLGENFSLKSPEEMKEAWSKYPEAVQNTQKIAEMCNVDIEFGVNRLPHYPLPKGVTPDQALSKLCESRLSEKYSTEKQAEAKERLDYELGVISKTGFASYFMIVADFVNEAKKRGILVGPGRGSAAGSIVSYLTNITGLDPLRYNLLFERFLNPERVSMPDIDLDFADDRRDEIIDYVREKYGCDHVAQIITFGTMAARAAVRDAGRALGFPYNFCDQVAKAIPMFTNFEEALEEATDLRQMYEEDPQVKRLVDTARKLEGVCRHASKHAAGVVITEEPLTDHVPLQLAATSGAQSNVVITQYAMNEIESLGLLKMDFLGLKNLTIIQGTLKRIKEEEIEIDIESLPLDDQDTYKLLAEGKTTGVFQLESSGMKKWLRQLKPTEFEDIISMVALYRPGPMDSIPDFVAAKHGKRNISYPHPILEPILKKTYGIIVTQDQVLQIAREFAGFSYAEADILRKAVGKKIKKLLDEQREKFIRGAIDNKNIDRVTSKKVWDFIEPFARYGFNRAHAACYAMIAYQTAYLKAHYPAQFMAALLTSDEGNIDRQAIEVAEAISINIEVLPPDINESGHDFTVVSNGERRESIRFGMGAIKNVGKGIIEEIIAERDERGKFSDVFDLFRRINSRNFNKKSVESLARSGAFDSIVERNQVLHNLEKLLEFNRSLQKQGDAGQQGLFGGGSTSLPEPRVNLEKAERATNEERLAWEKELLGLYLSDHPLKNIQGDLGKMIVPLSELDLVPGRESEVRVAGIITRITRIITKKQQPMLFAQIEDMAAKVEVLIFPSLLEKSQDVWTEGQIVLIEGKISDKDDEHKILANSVRPINKGSINDIKKDLRPIRQAVKANGDIESARRLVVKLESTLDRDKLSQVREILSKYNVNEGQGGVVVDLMLTKGGYNYVINTEFRVSREREVVEAIKKIVGERALRYD